MAPKTSVVVPVFNRGRMVFDTLESVHGQSTGDWECIVVDDGSTDDSFERAQEWATRDARFRVHRRKADQKGANVCRNEGLAAASGEYVVFLDSDDLLASRALAHRASLLDGRSDLDFAVCNAEFFHEQPGDEAGNCFRLIGDSPDLYRFLAADPPWITLQVTWRRSAIEQLAGWDGALQTSQDFDLHVRALLAGLSYEKVDVRDCYWRTRATPRTTIGGQAFNRTGLLAREATFRKITNLVKEHGRLEEFKAPLLNRYHRLIIQRWESAGEHQEALRVWRECRRLGIVDKRLMRTVRFYHLCRRFNVMRNRSGRALKAGMSARLSEVPEGIRHGSFSGLKPAATLLE